MKFSYNILAAGLLVLILSCNKNDSGSVTPTTPYAANVNGEVALYDESTGALDKSGMAVTVDSSVPVISGLTQSTGKFTVANVPFGNKTLVFEKAGYGTFKVFNIDHAYNNGAGTTLTTVYSLGRASTTTVTDVQASVSGTTVTISVTHNPAGSNGTPKYLRLFFHTRNIVSNNNFLKYSSNYAVKVNPAAIQLTKAELNGFGFPSGTTIYVRAYGDSFWSNDYNDPVIGRQIFPNLNAATSAAASFIVP